MALSGTITKAVGSYWRLRLYWTATQNTSNNTSTITSRLYWESTNSSYGAVYSSAPKSGSQKIHTTSSSFSNTAGLSGGQSKLIDTHVVTVTHNSNGDLSVGLSGSFGINVQLGSTYYGTVSLSGTAVLNSIPRESTLSEDPTWRAGEVLRLSVNRASSSFTHVAEIYALNANGTYGNALKTVSLEAAANVGFSTEEYEDIFRKLNGRSSTGSRVILKTYNGGTYVGETARNGIMMAPLASHPTTGYDAHQYITEEIDFPITRQFSFLDHTVRIKLGSYTKTFTNVGTSINWTPNEAEKDAMYRQMPNETEKNGTIEIDTFYNGIQIRETETRPLRFYLYGQWPVFNGVPRYADSATSSKTITGNDQYIVSGESFVSAYLDSSAGAVGQGGATIVKYVFQLAGRTIEVPYTTATAVATFGNITASTNQTLTVEAIDSRGQKATVSKTVLVVPYTRPSISFSAERTNGFEDQTLIKINGSIRPVKVGTVDKNSIRLIRYRTRLKTSSEWGFHTNLTPVMTGTTFKIPDIITSLSSTSSYDVEVEVQDQFETVKVVKTVGVGTPIFFIDSNKKSIGINKFPVLSDSFEIQGKTTISGTGASLTVDGKGEFGGELILGDTLRFSLGTDSTIENPSTGMRLFGNSSVGYVEFNSSSSLRTYVRTNRSRFEFDSAITAPSFTGTLYGEQISTTNKEANGYNKVSMLASPNHNSIAHIQHVSGGVSIGTGAATNSIDISFPAAFDSTPQWVVVSGINANSAHLSFAIYNVTRYGCTVYVTRLPSTGSGGFSSFYQVLAGGTRG